MRSARSEPAVSGTGARSEVKLGVGVALGVAPLLVGDAERVGETVRGGEFDEVELDVTEDVPVRLGVTERVPLPVAVGCPVPLAKMDGVGVLGGVPVPLTVLD